MFVQIEARGDVTEMIEAVKRLDNALRPANVARIAAPILDREIKSYFESGGPVGKTGGASWEPTDEFWVEHMLGKAGNKPLVWTGFSAQASGAKASGEQVEMFGPEYLRKFQPGLDYSPGGHKETFPVEWDDSGWKKLYTEGFWNMDTGEDGGTITRNIKVHERNIFDVYPEDVDDIVHQLFEEAGLG